MMPGSEGVGCAVYTSRMSQMIPLACGAHAIVDDQDAHLVSGRPWHARKDRNSVYAVSAARLPSGKRRNDRMHAVVVGPIPAGMLIDHMNGNGLDNRRSNLRVCTVAQNSRNAARRPTGTSGIVGVRWDGKRLRWEARVEYAENSVLVCRTRDRLQAAHAYEEAASALFGPFYRPQVLPQGPVLGCAASAGVMQILGLRARKASAIARSLRSCRAKHNAEYAEKLRKDQRESVRARAISNWRSCMSDPVRKEAIAVQRRARRQAARAARATP